MNRKMVQITEEEVIPSIVNDKTVYRVNLDRVTVIDLSNKSVNQIRNDFGNANFVYFIMEDENE